MSRPTELVRVSEVDPRVRVALRYATPDNLAGRVLYGSAEAWLRRETARKLSLAQEILSPRGVFLLVLDAYRPPSAQQALWAALPDPRFVAPPERGSRHTRGAAVDVTLASAGGDWLEMPSDYDEPTERAGRSYLGATPLARQHLQWLTDAMTGAGFRIIQSEWWHYDDTDWERYPLLEWEFPGTSGPGSPSTVSMGRLGA